MLLFLHSLSHLLVDAACAATLFGPVRELGDLSSLLLLYNTLAFSAQCLAGLAADRLRRLNRRKAEPDESAVWRAIQRWRRGTG